VVPELAGELGVVVLPEAPLGELAPLEAGLELLWPEVLPDAPVLDDGVVLEPEVAPAPVAASFMQRSFSVPRRCAHFALSAPAAELPVVWPVVPLAPAEPLAVPLDCPVVLPLAPEAAEPLDELEGVWALVLPLDELGVWALVLPLPDMLLLGLLDCADVDPADCAPVLPELLEDVCANEALDSARSAAAVALTRTFRFIWMLLWRNGWGGNEMQRPDTQTPCRSPRRSRAERTSAARVAARAAAGNRPRAGAHAGAFRAAAAACLHRLAIGVQAALALRAAQPGASARFVARRGLRHARHVAGADARARPFGGRGGRSEEAGDKQQAHVSVRSRTPRRGRRRGFRRPDPCRPAHASRLLRRRGRCCAPLRYGPRAAHCRGIAAFR
jgi:hypothetical protein